MTFKSSFVVIWQSRQKALVDLHQMQTVNVSIYADRRNSYMHAYTYLYLHTHAQHTWTCSYTCNLQFMSNYLNSHIFIVSLKLELYLIFAYQKYYDQI